MTEQVDQLDAIRATYNEPVTMDSLNQDFQLGIAQGYCMAFAKFASQRVRMSPDVNLSPEELELIHHVLNSERKELDDALDSGDLIEVVDGLCDEIYVLLWVAVACGVYLPPFLKEVCVNNHLKTLLPAERDEKGKLQKPPGHVGPRIKEMLALLLQDDDSPSDLSIHPSPDLIR